MADSTKQLQTRVSQLIENEDWEKLQKLAKKELKKAPKADFLHFALGLCAEAEGEYEAAKSAYDAAVEAGSVVARVRRFTLRIDMREELEIAAADFECLAVADLPNDQKGEFLGGVDRLAMIHQSNERYPEAIELWNYSISVIDDDPNAYQRRGRCFFHTKDYQRAIADADKQIELEPNNRIAWLCRGEAKRASGDVPGADADSAHADGLYDFDVSAEERAELDAVLLRDRQENLEKRLALFSEKDPDKIESEFGPVPMIIEHGWAVSHFPADEEDRSDLSYSMGLFYRYEHPELMVISKDIDVYELKAALDALAKDVADGKRVDVGHEVSFGKKKARFEKPSSEDLEAYPFGYGEHFYRHFMNRTKIPLLVAKL